MESTNVPQILYKYRTWQKVLHKKILTHNELHFAKPSDFNDPFECNLPLIFEIPEELLAERINRLISYEYPYAEGEMKKLKFNELFAENVRKFKDISEQVKIRTDWFNELDSILGVLSLSRENDNKKLWKDFSKNHRGFCVGLDTNTLQNFHENFSGGIWGDVYYKPEPELPPIYPIYLNEEERGEAFLNNTYCLRIKYEKQKEYRLLKLYVKDRNICVPSEAYREIILGLKMLPEHKQEIAKIVKQRFPHAQLWEIFSTEMEMREYRGNEK